MSTRSSRLPTAAGYVAMLGAATVAYLLIRDLGEGLVAPPAPAAAAAHGAVAHASPLAHVLVALAAIVVASRALGEAFRRFLGQPPVIGEIVAGILLGPSVLGMLLPGVQAFLLPPDVAPYVGNVARIGVVLFMFLVGLELDPAAVRRNSHATLAISHASIVVPFLLGSGLALVLYPMYSHAGVSFTSFSLFAGISLSVTAFPVLARILTDRRVQRTQLGVMALACAAVDDVTAWTLLAFVAGVATADTAGVGWTVAWVALYLAVMVAVVRPLATRFAARVDGAEDPPGNGALAAVLVALLVSAAVTEAIGIHALFGAFLLGAFLPHDGRLATHLRTRMEDIVVVLFLPAFFAFTGMRTQIGLMGSWVDWAMCLAIIGVATAGKFGGTFVAARLTGHGWRESGALGILMNTRGLMELIVLNVGLDLGVISPTLFAMLVVMALVTTFTTTPLLDLLLAGRGFSDAPEGAPGGAAGVTMRT